jgi:hypothetical protein
MKHSVSNAAMFPFQLLFGFRETSARADIYRDRRELLCLDVYLCNWIRAT